MRATFLITCLALAVACPVRAADSSEGVPDELDALTLADKAPELEQRATQPWSLFAEGAAGRNTLVGGAGRENTRRLSLDLRYDGILAPGVRALLSNRLDLRYSNGSTAAQDINTLREAYLSWAPGDRHIVDFGRVNVRHGAAMGYNPTDWFKENAVRSVVSLDPAVLRENRQGTVVLRGQQLWDAGSLTALLSPKLGTSPDAGTWSLNAGATNPSNRWLVTGSYRLDETLSPQVLLYGGDSTPTQLGLNLSAGAGDATVVFAEFALGKGRSLQAQALGLDQAENTQRRAAIGMSYTTGFNLTFTAEAEYNSAAPSGSDWDALAGSGSLAQLRVLALAFAGQDLPARQAWFLHATWKDFLLRRLDVSAFVRRESATGSRAQWLEIRYHLDDVDLAVQWQQFSGSRGSIYRTLPLENAVEVALRYYF